jgi:hypothetical protein
MSVATAEAAAAGEAAFATAPGDTEDEPGIGSLRHFCAGESSHALGEAAITCTSSSSAGLYVLLAA